MRSSRNREGAPARSWAPVLALLALPLQGLADEGPSREKARLLSNPVGYSATVLREGRRTYLRLCQYCHGADGRAQANPDFEAPSLRAPSEWRFGDSDGELFLSIRDGAGHEMPPFGDRVAEDEIWELVHFVRSIGPPELRPDARGAER